MRPQNGLTPPGAGPFLPVFRVAPLDGLTAA